jgi:hypothetical protein
MHRFEFPISKGTSGDSAEDFDSNFRVSWALFLIGEAFKSDGA